MTKEFTRYEDLSPEIDLSRIGQAVRDIVREWQKKQNAEDRSLRKLADQLGAEQQGVTANAIKLFLNKFDVKKRIYNQNKVLPFLYNFVCSSFDKFPDSVQLFAANALYEIDPKLLSQENTQRIQKLRLDAMRAALLKWMLVDDRDITRICERLSGNFFLFRRSAEDQNILIKSTIKFFHEKNKIETKEKTEIIMKVFHRMTTREGNEKVSEGIVVPATENIYCVMETDNYGAIETIVFHEDGGRGEIQKAMGLITTTGLRRIPISAKMALIKFSPESDEVASRVALDNPNEVNEYLSKEVLPILGKSEAIMAPF